MKLEPFALERLQSTFENQVAFNLSESGVHPLTLGELLEDARVSRRAAGRTAPLHADQRHRAAARRRSRRSTPARRADHVQVTNGGAEANYLTTWNLLEPGDEVVMMVPNFMQAAGLARAFGADVKTVAAPVERSRQRSEAIDLRRARAAGDAAHQADRDLQSEQPDRRAVRGRRSRSRSRRSPIGTAAGSCPTRSTAAPNATAARRRRCGGDPNACW